MAVVVLAIVVIFVSISKGWIGYMPPVEELENPNYKFATEIFSEDGKVLGTWSLPSDYSKTASRRYKNSFASSSAERFNSDPAASRKEIKKYTVKH